MLLRSQLARTRPRGETGLGDPRPGLGESSPPSQSSRTGPKPPRAAVHTETPGEGAKGRTGQGPSRDMERAEGGENLLRDPRTTLCPSPPRGVPATPRPPLETPPAQRSAAHPAPGAPQPVPGSSQAPVPRPPRPGAPALTRRLLPPHPETRPRGAVRPTAAAKQNGGPHPFLRLRRPDRMWAGHGGAAAPCRGGRADIVGRAVREAAQACGGAILGRSGAPGSAGEQRREGGSVAPGGDSPHRTGSSRRCMPEVPRSSAVTAASSAMLGRSDGTLAVAMLGRSPRTAPRCRHLGKVTGPPVPPRRSVTEHRGVLPPVTPPHGYDITPQHDVTRRDNLLLGLHAPRPSRALFSFFCLFSSFFLKNKCTIPDRGSVQNIHVWGGGLGAGGPRTKIKGGPAGSPPGDGGSVRARGNWGGVDAPGVPKPAPPPHPVPRVGGQHPPAPPAPREAGAPWPKCVSAGGVQAPPGVGAPPGLTGCRAPVCRRARRAGSGCR